MASISNQVLSIEVANKGAELQSIFHRQHQLEYMWSAQPVWAKKSPVLFPIVGGIKNGSYTYKGNTYHLGRHGFARDNTFNLAAQTEDSLTFTLTSSDKTREVYPFDFVFSVRYTLEENKLKISFMVENPGTEDLLFSVGAHPAFAVPLVKGTAYEDYYLEFAEVETVGIYPLSKDGLLEKTTTLLLENTNKLPLTRELFYKDALVFKELKSTAISLRSDKTEHGITVDFPSFPFVGIWAASDADFVCIEPWSGIADSVASSGELESKEGIHTITTAETFILTYVIEVF